MSGLNAGTFLKKLEGTVTGFGYKKEMEGVDINRVRLATGAILAADSGNPMRASLETSFEGIQLASSQTALGTITVKVPRDYDKDNDYLRLRFLANSAGDTDTPKIDAALYRKRAGAALSADLDPTISAVVNTNTALAAWVEVNCDGLGLQAGDAITIILSAGGTRGTTDALNVYAVEAIYRSDLVYNVIDER